MYAQETDSLANLLDLIFTLAIINICILRNTNQSKYGLNLVYLLENEFHLDVHSYQVGIVFA